MTGNGIWLLSYVCMQCCNYLVHSSFLVGVENQFIVGSGMTSPLNALIQAIIASALSCQILIGQLRLLCHLNQGSLNIRSPFLGVHYLNDVVTLLNLMISLEF